jgi:hypothetical protein
VFALNRIRTTTLTALPIALWSAPLAAQPAPASFAHAVPPVRVTNGDLSATPLSGKSAYAQTPSIAKITSRIPTGFRIAAKTSPLQISSCADACETQRAAPLPEGFEDPGLHRTVEVYAGDIAMGRTASHLSAKMGYIKQAKNAAEPTRHSALALCDRHIDNCRSEINPHEMQLNPIAREEIFNRNRAGKSFEEHVGVKLSYQFR